MSNLLVRTLVGYKHVSGAEGNEIVDDLAEVPAPSADGLTYTFTLKEGVRFGPPLSRAITSDDVRFAFERIATPSVIAQYGFYYSVIAGLDAFRRRRGRHDLGYRDARRADDRLHPQRACSRLLVPRRHAGGRPDPAGDR